MRHQQDILSSKQATMQAIMVLVPEMPRSKKLSLHADLSLVGGIEVKKFCNWGCQKALQGSATMHPFSCMTASGKSSCT